MNVAKSLFSIEGRWSLHTPHIQRGLTLHLPMPVSARASGLRSPHAKMPRRAIRVCTACHSRKVRCDIDIAGVPCKNCRDLGAMCAVRQRKDYSSRNSNVHPLPSDASGSAERAFIGAASPNDQAELVAAVVARPSQTNTPFFIGTGGYADILATLTTIDRRHFTIPAETQRSLSEEDLSYLQQKGCFSLPPQSKELIRAYFLFVHPSFPILEAKGFCRQCADGRFERINLLLLWSMLSVAASYVPDYAQAPIKAAFVERAQLLFHLTQENDKEVLVQSALLLSFWFAEAEDTKQSWYWAGIAFSIAQTLGLHLDSSAGSQIAVITRHNLWRACMLRDVWLAFAMGRPLRLNPDDCTVACHPTSSQLFHGIMLFNESREQYTETESLELFNVWQHHIRLGYHLRDVLSPNKPQIKQPQNLPDMCTEHLGGAESLALSVSKRHLRLAQCAVEVAFYKRQHNLEKARKAASETTSILRAFLADDTIKYVAPVAVPHIMPATLVFLQDQQASRSSSPGEHDNIQVCIRFLGTIDKNYPAAAILKRLIEATQRWVRQQ